jgi:hypothetical protein
MWKDPIVEEVRKARRQIEKEYGPDTDAFLQHIYDQQKKVKSRLVSRGPKKRLTRKVA